MLYKEPTKFEIEEAKRKAAEKLAEYKRKYGIVLGEALYNYLTGDQDSTAFDKIKKHFVETLVDTISSESPEQKAKAILALIDFVEIKAKQASKKQSLSDMRF